MTPKQLRNWALLNMLAADILLVVSVLAAITMAYFDWIWFAAAWLAIGGVCLVCYHINSKIYYRLR